MRVASFLLATLLLAGCASPGPDVGETDTAESLADAPMQTVTLADSREGTILYRLGGEGSDDYTGDPYSYCVQLPPGVVAVDLTLTWADPRPLVLEFQNGQSYHSPTDDDPAQAMMATSPASLHVDEPRGGEWQIFIGPPVSDAARVWHLDLAWTLPAGMTLDQIIDKGYCP